MIPGGLTGRSYAHHFGPTKSAPHFVYRCYDADGDLIYIGCTANVKKRIAAHRRGDKAASRWLSICMTRYEVEGPFPDRDAGLEAERLAIGTEDPIFNQRECRRGARWAKNDIGHYLVMRGHVELARATACTCWRETREAGFRESWCWAHVDDETRPVWVDDETTLTSPTTNLAHQESA